MTCQIYLGLYNGRYLSNEMMHWKLCGSDLDEWREVLGRLVRLYCLRSSGFGVQERQENKVSRQMKCLYQILRIQIKQTHGHVLQILSLQQLQKAPKTLPKYLSQNQRQKLRDGKSYLMLFTNYSMEIAVNGKSSLII